MDLQFNCIIENQHGYLKSNLDNFEQHDLMCHNTIWMKWLTKIKTAHDYYTHT